MSEKEQQFERIYKETENFGRTQFVREIQMQINDNKKKDKEIERLNNIINELHSDLKTLWIVLWNMDTEMTGYQNEVFDKYYDEFHKGSDKE